MLIRPDGDGVIAIGQASHAWLSGQLARAWGGVAFDPPHPWEEVCLAAEQHDVGMAEWDLTPLLEAEGRPQSFMEMALADHLRLWSAAPRKLLTQSHYAALLVSMHGRALYELRDLTSMSPADRAAVLDYLARERAFQQRLIARLRADDDEVTRNQRLLFAWDGLSLALCLRWGNYVAARVPASETASADVRLEPRGSDADESFMVDPWPFRDREVTVRCEGRRLSLGHDSAMDMRAQLDGAEIVTLAFRLTPK